MGRRLARLHAGRRRSAGPSAIAEKLGVAREHAERAGRDPARDHVRHAPAAPLPSRSRQGRALARSSVHAVARADRLSRSARAWREYRPRASARRRLLDHARGQHGDDAARPRARPVPAGAARHGRGVASTGARRTTSCRASSPRSKPARVTSRSATTSASSRAPTRRRPPRSSSSCVRCCARTSPTSHSPLVRLIVDDADDRMRVARERATTWP